jgi:membrane associated rhomboid family serine protease
MVPLRDDNPTRRLAIVTIVLIAINVAVFALVQPHGSTPAVVKASPHSADWPTNLAEEEFLYRQATVPCEVISGKQLDRREIRDAFQNKSDQCDRSRKDAPVFPTKLLALSILVSMFLHGGWLHLLGNMLFLWIFGNNIEDRFGSATYLVFYLLSGTVATLAHVIANPDSLVPVVGASGAIAGVMGAYLVLFPRIKVISVLAFLPFIPFRVRAWVLLGVWFVSQFWVNPADGVAWVAHVAGFAFGAITTLLFRSRLTDPPTSTLSAVSHQRR